ncbi:energy transducer TonB [Thiotrichales bacterium 19S3-7]|nr:energy transducer TonB [Thiotrichales bacterium 19S3-7]MCF6802839.1 energy transducer TonB [Thiotrichales bacterium 19S3-11]
MLRLTFAFILSICINLGLFYAVVDQTQHKKWTLGATAYKAQSIESINLNQITFESQKVKQVKKEDQDKKTQKNTLTKSKPQKKSKPNQSSIKATSTAQKIIKTPPKIITKAKLNEALPDLKYPQEAIKNNTSGKVIVKAIIDNNGNVKTISVIHSSGSTILDQAAINWFKSLKFTPAQSTKGPITSNITQTITFKLKEAKA